MHITVTGSHGFIGSHLVKYFSQTIVFKNGKFLMPVQDSPLDDSTSLNKIFVTNANVAQSSTSDVTTWTE